MPLADAPLPPPAQVRVRSAASFNLSTLDTAADDKATNSDANPPSAKLDLGIVRPRCPEATGAQIVVCATNQEQYRLRPLPDTFADPQGLPKAQTRIGNATADIHTEAEQLANGVISNRLMIGLKWPF